MHSFKKLPHWTTFYFCSIPAGLWLLVNKVLTFVALLYQVLLKLIQNMPKIYQKLFDKMFGINYSFYENLKVHIRLCSKANKV